MQSTKDEIVVGTINNIVENKGVYVSLDGDRFGYLPISQMSTWADVNGVILLKRWQQIQVAILKDDGSGRVLLSQKELDKITEKERMKVEKEVKENRRQEFISIYQVGTIFSGAIITKIWRSNVYIRLGEFEGVITKDELNYNVIESPSDVVFVGEILNVVYLGEKNNELHFSLKHLTDKPYEDELYDLKLHDLLEFCGLKGKQFIGQAKSYGEFRFIENLYACGEDQGKLLVDPFFGYNLRAFVIGNNIHLKEGAFYKIT